MNEELEQFPQQFSWEPEVVRENALPPQGVPVVLCGMGGSHLGAELLLTDLECPPLLIHSDYGLPRLPDAWRQSALFIASSWSGETEETIDAARAALAEGHPVAVMASGGTLLSLAEEYALPFVRFPDTDLQPRATLGFQMIALARLLKDKALEERVREAGRTLDVPSLKEEGALLAQSISGRIPAFYASVRNKGIAYLLKIEINETGKRPATYNVLPELCHNEVSGYETGTDGLLPVFIEDDADTGRVQMRTALLKEMFEERGIEALSLVLSGDGPLSKAARAVLVGGYAGVVLAKERGVSDEEIPLISDFKRRLSNE